MSQRVRRKFTSSKFRVNNYLCKTFLEPVEEYDCGFYIWNIAFAIGKSNRQLNDWYRMRKNKRARSLKSKLTKNAINKIAKILSKRIEKQNS